MEGRTMLVLLAPAKNLQKKKEEPAPAEKEAEA
jgi:hypothetical protein